MTLENGKNQGGIEGILEYFHEAPGDIHLSAPLFQRIVFKWRDVNDVSPLESVPGLPSGGNHKLKLTFLVIDRERIAEKNRRKTTLRT